MIANLSLKFNLQSWVLGITSLLLILETYLYNVPIISGIVFLVYLTVLGKSIGDRIFLHQDIQWWGGIIITISSISLLGTLVYYPFKITPEISLLTVLFPLVLLLKKKKETTSSHTEQYKKPTRAVYLFFTLEAVLLTCIIIARNGELMQSPWLAFPAWFFIIFAISTTLFVYCLHQENSPRIMLIGSIVHFFIFYSIAAVVYKLGYGFDGFIHRATELWISEHGFISPKEPFYIGQYGLVVTLSRITGIAIRHIDTFLVPVLASISIPTLLYVTLPRAWNITKNTTLALSLFIPFIFFLTFNLTTPHNFVLLLTVLTVISLVGYWYQVTTYFLPCVLALCALSVHPLLGAPLLVITITTILLKRINNTKLSMTLFTALTGTLALIPLSMFSLQQWLNGYGLPTLVNPFSNTNLFLEFFKRPFWYEEKAAWFLEILYAWQYLITPVIILIAIIGLIHLRKTKLAWVLFCSSVGLFVGAFLLRTLITFPNVSFHEQGNYPLRLLVGAIILLIPLGMYGVWSVAAEKINIWCKKFQINKTILYILSSIKIGILLMLSLYFSYPQVNGKVYFPGFNVTKYDQDVVEYIHNQNAEYNYAVLSTILTGVTALTEYPFAHYFETTQGPQFYYAIPSGGPLQLAYEDMMYKGQKRETIDKVFQLTSANKVYFVVPWYWGNAREIIEGAKKTATSWHAIEDKMWIFEYQK